ncbi:RICIN domain-containing protein (plasmid) [Streptomyces sp. NBC_01351]|uniref:RICIN domain-containing protein n=1 Tax=Streptomyces sp. NBC_01351 TaxID=2903833 RepID=UPI002E308398|nr:RICIN domain-containing protein [Streptomyces sp. NBC_01351]
MAEANALAQFLRELTAELTVSRLEDQYRLSRSVWSEYRSGLKIIPMSRLTQIIEDRFPRDARTPAEQLLKARRLHTEAMASLAALAPAAPASPPATPTSGSAAAPAPSPDELSSPNPSPVEAQAAPPRDVRQEADTSGLSADNPPTSQDPAPTTAVQAPQPAAPRRRTDRFSRWRTPAQWAALGVLVTVLVVANQADRSKDKAADTAASSELGPGQVQIGDPSIAPEPLATEPTTPDPSQPGASQDPPQAPAAPPVAPSTPPTATPQPTANNNQDQAPQAERIPAGVPVRIVNRNSGLCLAVPGASTEVIDLNQFGCGNFPDHFWRLEPWGRGAGTLYRVVNDNSGLCAAVPAANKASGVVVNQFPCGDYPDHLWRLDRDGADEAGRPQYRIVNDNSGLCMTIAGADTRQTAAVVQLPCGSRPERQWRLTAR